MIADLDTLLTALYVELTDRIIPSCGLARRGPGKPRKSPTPNWPAWRWRRCCCAMTTSGTGCVPQPGTSGTGSPAAGPKRVRRPGQGRRAADGGRAAVAGRSRPGTRRCSADGPTPVPCGQSVITAKRSDLFGGPATGTAPATRAGTGEASCCSSAPATGPSPGSAWPTPSSSGSVSKPGRCSRTSPPTARRPAPPSSPTRACPARTPRTSSPARTWA